MTADSNIRPPHGVAPVDSLFPPPKASLLTEGALAGIPPQQHTTLINTAVYPVEPNQIPRPTFLPEAQMPHGITPPATTILPELPHPYAIPPQTNTSVLPPDRLEGLSVPKRPNLVRPMPKKTS